MSSNANSAAFPLAFKENTPSFNPGLTKREHFAAIALQAAILVPSSPWPTGKVENSDDMWLLNSKAALAVQYADALIKALNS